MNLSDKFINHFKLFQNVYRNSYIMQTPWGTNGPHHNLSLTLNTNRKPFGKKTLNNVNHISVFDDERQ